MTKQEFIGPFNDLKAHFGPNAFSDKRAALLFKLIEELPAAWWQKTSAKMILSNDARYDLQRVAEDEIRTLRAFKRREEESEAWQNFSREMSDRGYQETLDGLGARSLWEAIEKKKTNQESA